jgi:hypothetical protein
VLLLYIYIYIILVFCETVSEARVLEGQKRFGRKEDVELVRCASRGYVDCLVASGSSPAFVVAFVGEGGEDYK